MKSSLIIMTLNERKGLESVFDKIPFTEVNEVLAIDGGSTDGSVEFLRSRGIRVVGQDKKGRGEAFRIAAREAGADNLIIFSPDGNEDPADIPKIISGLEGGSDLVIASRFMKGSRNEEDDKVFPWRAWANRAFTFIANIIWNRKRFVTDTINGYRGITRKSFEMLKLDAPGFVIEYQMSIRAMKAGLRISEIPTQEGKRIGRDSGAKSIPTGLLFLRFLVREIFYGNKFLSGGC